MALMSDFDGIKQMPHSVQAEQAVLGAIIIDQNNLEKLSGLSEDNFYVDAHRVIYSSIKSLFASSRSIDLVTLVENIKSSSGDKDFDVAKYIKTICDIASENSNVEEYVRIIKEKAILRALITASRDISEKAFSEGGDIKSVVDFAEKSVMDVTGERITSGLVHINEACRAVYDSLQERRNNPNIELGVKTGFGDLDNYFVGLGTGDLVLVGARPGVGKTTFCLNLALNIGKAYPNKDIAIFSLEMTKEQLASRLISTEALIDNNIIRRCSFTDDQWRDIASACSTLAGTGIYIDDSSDITVTEIKSKVRRLKNLGLIVIDYLQLMRGEAHHENRVLEVADITRSLKILAKEMGIPVILCSQLARPQKNTKEKRPGLSELRDSGAIEQDADIVMLLYRENFDTGVSNEKSSGNSETSGKVECIIAKNRHGATGKVDFAWHGQYFKFVQIEEKYDNAQ